MVAAKPLNEILLADVELRVTEVAVDGFRVDVEKSDLVSYSKWHVNAVLSVLTLPLSVAVETPTAVGAVVVTIIA